MVKKFIEPRVWWKYLAKMWKNSEKSSAFAASQRHRSARLIGSGIRCAARVYL